MRRLTPQQRKKLKKPLGLLYKASSGSTIEALNKLIHEETHTTLVSVGDYITEYLFNHNIKPDLFIVDDRIMRKQIPPIKADADVVIKVKNPPGTITDQAWSAIEKASNSCRRTKIHVDGEEDLLALVAILTVPLNSIVLYGQPLQGVVVVRVTTEIRERVERIVEAMTKTDQL
ncbi:GTP-dependent dephospho-CoA kinase family protein [Candidatus Bathyarchaeota archaeon]|nr:GTP-dependent dephospho-CoA kinase family protein [Candidatus Bathyarchaeota archaeon]